MGWLIFFGIILLSIRPLVYLKEKSDYNKSIYAKLSPNHYNTVRNDIGLYGEYLTVTTLEEIQGDKEILINIYLPKANKNDETTEIDVVMVHEKGIFVFESKNYSGWIFGTEKDKQWTVSLKNGIKNRFYNPIRQNQTHIKALQALFPYLEPEYFKSIIVFSERCELKKLNLTSTDIPIIKRNYLYSTIQDIIEASTTTLDFKDISGILSILNNFANASQELKEQHIQNINQNYKVHM